jgi:MFS family permease
MTRPTPSALKLGALLIAASALLLAGDPSNTAVVLTRDRIDSSAFQFGMAFAAAGLGGFVIIPAAIWVDRHGPHPIMAIGAVVTAFAALVLIPATNIAGVYLGMFISGVGGAGTATLIFFAVIARSGASHRGALFGAIAFFAAIRPALAIRAIADKVTNLEAALATAALLSLIAAFLLYRYLPRLTPPTPIADQPEPPLSQIWRDRHLRFMALAIGLLFALYHAINLTLSMYQPTFLGGFIEYDTVSFFTLARAVPAVGALAIGIASDRIPLRRLLIATSLAAIILATITSMASGPIASPALVIAFGVVQGGFLVLPWLFLVEHFPVRRFATLAIILTFLAPVVGSFAIPPLAAVLISKWDITGGAFMLIALSLLAVALSTRFPRHPSPQPVD